MLEAGYDIGDPDTEEGPEGGTEVSDGVQSLPMPATGPDGLPVGLGSMQPMGANTGKGATQ